MFNKDRAIIAQNSATAAAAILANMTTDSLEDTLALFDAVRTHIFEGSLALAESNEPTTTASTGFGNRGGFTKPSNGGGSNDAGAGVVMKFGKYAGRSIGDVYETDSDYIVWLSEKSNNDFLKTKATEFLASRG